MRTAPLPLPRRPPKNGSGKCVLTPNRACSGDLFFDSYIKLNIKNEMQSQNNHRHNYSYFIFAGRPCQPENPPQRQVNGQKGTGRSAARPSCWQRFFYFYSSSCSSSPKAGSSPSWGAAPSSSAEAAARLWRIFCSISSQISGWSVRYWRAFSLPWPIRSPL